MAIDISKDFFYQNAAKQVLFVTYELTAPRGATPIVEFATCFVIEVEDIWFLVTAGHVLTRLRLAMEQGYGLNNFIVRDQMAGRNFPIGIPIPFDQDKWVAIDIDNMGDPLDGSDFAATMLSPLIRAGLEVGGVVALGEPSWADRDPQDYELWGLTGYPAESFAHNGDGNIQAELRLVPLSPALCPSEGVPRPTRIYATINEGTVPGIVPVRSIVGMSGGPIFGIRNDGTHLRYGVIGVQSGWYEQSRVVYFCPIRCFAASIAAGVRDAIARSLDIAGRDGI